MATETRTITLPDGNVTGTIYPSAEHARLDRVFVLAHGAGAGQTSGFMVQYATALALAGLDVVTFDFPYIAAGRRVPDPPARLEDCYRAVIAQVTDSPNLADKALFIGGKSMGGRIATQIAAGPGVDAVRGLVLLGYPLHPPGKPQQLRAKHLPGITKRMLFIQGSRDTFGTPEELRPILEPLGQRADLWVVEDGDHSFKVPARRGPPASIHGAIQARIVEWIQGVVGVSGRTMT